METPDPRLVRTLEICCETEGCELEGGEISIAPNSPLAADWDLAVEQWHNTKGAGHYCPACKRLRVLRKWGNWAAATDQPFRRRMGVPWHDTRLEGQRMFSICPQCGREYPASIFFQAMKFVVLADPSLPIP